jgi:hypothetical protein
MPGHGTAFFEGRIYCLASTYDWHDWRVIPEITCESVLQKLGMKRSTYQQPLPVNPRAQVGLHGDFGLLLFAQNIPLDGRV